MTVEKTVETTFAESNVETVTLETATVEPAERKQSHWNSQLCKNRRDFTSEKQRPCNDFRHFFSDNSAIGNNSLMYSDRVNRNY